MSLFDETDFLSLSRDLRHSLGKQKTKQTGVNAIDENPYSPFDDLELLEEKMPNREDFI